MTDNCGCEIDYGPLGLAPRGEVSIVYCPMHKAAEEMLETIERFLEIAESIFKHGGDSANLLELGGLVFITRPFIAKAKGEEVRA